MKIAFITVLYNTPDSEVIRLKKEISNLGVKNYSTHFIDNTINNKGYAYGVNLGIKKALAEKANLMVIMNPDISLAKLKANKILDPGKHFDLWGFSFEQENKTYYGGEIDKWRMSGGLISQKSNSRFQTTDFISGSLMFIKKQVIDKVGLFNEKYFLYYEDVEFCHRAKQAGFRIGIDNELNYKHFEFSKENPQKDRYLFINRLKFLLKYGSFKQKVYEIIRIPKTVFEYVKKKPFLFNFFSLNFSSLFNKSIHFLLFLFLINNLSIKQYGIYVLVWAHISLLSSFLDFGTTSYGLVHLSKDTNKRFFSLFSLRFCLSIFVFAATILLSYIFKYDSSIKSYILLTGFTIFTSMFSGSFVIYSSLVQKLYLSSLVSMIFNLISTIGLIIIMMLYKNLLLLFISIFIFYNIYSLANFILLRRQIDDLKFKIDFPTWIPIIKKSFVFLLISFLAGLYFRLDVFLLNFMKGQREVGIYSSGYKFLDALLLFAASYNFSATPILARLKDQGKKPLVAKIKKDFVFLLLLGVSITVIILLLSPIFLPFIMKGDYARAIGVLRIIVFAFPLILITSIFLNGLYVIGKAKVVVWIFIVQIIFNFSLNYVFIPKYSYFASSYITVIGELMNMIITFLLFRKYLRKL